MYSKSINFASFTQIILAYLKEKLGEGYTVFAHNVKRNNGVELTGIVISRAGSNTSPTFYINEMYRDDITEKEVKETAKQLYQQFRKTEGKTEMDLSDFLDYKKIKDKIAVKLINAEKNEELLKSVPHKIFYNLALVVYYSVEETPFGGKGAILIYHTHRQQWKIEEEELLGEAIRNTPRMFPGKIESMGSVMQQIITSEFGRNFDEKELSSLGISLEEWTEMFFPVKKSGEKQVSMYVLSNHQKLYGAVCMLYPDLLKNFTYKMGQDCYILPSSVHEVILVPANETVNWKELREIVTDINRTQVSEEEILADCIYYYDRATDDILLL